MVLAQKCPFFQLFFCHSIGQENVFNDILERKNVFFRLQKHEIEKVEEIDIFPRELTHGFGPKMAILQTFFF